MDTRMIPSSHGPADSQPPLAITHVSIGSTVVCRFNDGEVTQVTLGRVADPERNIISTEAPLSRALLGARVGDICPMTVRRQRFMVEVLQVLQQTSTSPHDSRDATS